MYIKPRILRYTPSDSSDVAEHRTRIVPDGTAFDYDIPYDVTPSTPNDNTQVAVNVATLSRAPTNDGVYDIYVTAADAVGNESDPLEIPDADFDFNPPSAPLAGSLD